MIPTAQRRASALVLAGLTAALTACFDDPVVDTIRQPGEMTATLVSPNGDEGSAVLELRSGTVLELSSTESTMHVYGVQTTPGRIVVLRLLPGEITFRIVADDVNNPPAFGVLEVGGPDDALRPDLSGYSVRLGGGGS